jgi:hypothetical protein
MANITPGHENRVAASGVSHREMNWVLVELKFDDKSDLSNGRVRV